MQRVKLPLAGLLIFELDSKAEIFISILEQRAFYLSENDIFQ
jgi:hypothetical protein